MHGPTGVKYATQRIQQVLREEQPGYVLRVDIKSFYKSIQHHKLIQDVRRYYADLKVQFMLEEVIKNPIETGRGYRNPGSGIALRGPLSQFFGGIFLKKLDDAFDNMRVTYLRYQDDILVLCHTRRQLNRCRRRMTWTYDELLDIFIQSCLDPRAAAIAYDLRRSSTGLSASLSPAWPEAA